MEVISNTMYARPADGMFYSSYSKAGQQILADMRSILLNCLVEIMNCRSPGEDITLTDFGTADGGNVIDHMNCMIERIQAVRGKGQQINIILQDQIHNDFNTLIRNVKGLNGNSSIKEGHNVNLLISGSSMFQKCLPKNSIDLGCTTVALHWLSKWPVNIQAGISVFDADEYELSRIKDQQKADLKQFIIYRGKEMKKASSILDLALQMMGFVQSWLYNTILCGLSDGRNEKEKSDIVNQYFDRLKQYYINKKWTKGYKSTYGYIIFKKNKPWKEKSFVLIMGE